jgi:hypothetical protein
MPSKWNLKQWLTSNCGLTLTTNRLKNAQVIADIIHRRTGYKIKTRTVHNLLEKQPRTFDSRILQPICDAFRCNLDNFFTVTPSSAPPANLLNDLDLQPRIKPYAIAGNECLRSFIARVQLAAIQEAVSICDNYPLVARRFGYARSSLHNLHARAQKITGINQPAPDKGSHNTFGAPIPLPPAIFRIKANENLNAFIRRVQLAVILQTTNLEGNKRLAALRLGYSRTSLVTLISNLRSSSEINLRRPNARPRMVPAGQARVDRPIQSESTRPCKSR